MHQMRSLMGLRNRMTLALTALTVVLNAPWAVADIYRCDSAPGVITLSNVEKGENCKKMILPSTETLHRGVKPQTNAPLAPPSADAANRHAKSKLRYEQVLAERKRIILEEMGLERERLAAASAKIKTFNPDDKMTDRQAAELSALQQKQSLHQANIDLLQKELNKQ